MRTLRHIQENDKNSREIDRELKENKEEWLSNKNEILGLSNQVTDLLDYLSSAANLQFIDEESKKYFFKELHRLREKILDRNAMQTGKWNIIERDFKVNASTL